MVIIPKLWTIIRHLSGRNTNSGVVFLEENDEHIREPLQMAEIFNTHFSNLAKNLTDSNINSYDPGTLINLVSKLDLTSKAISTNKATGIDDLSA